MRKRRFSRVRHRSRPLSDGWHNLRYRWYTTRKGPPVFILVMGLVVTAFGYFLHSALTRTGDVKHLTCLAFNVYFEARGEPTAGQYAVAEVTMNRVASGRYPGTVCGVVHQKKWDPLRKRYVSAFSWNELNERPSPEDETFRRAWEVAEAVYHGRHTPTLGGALHYHASYIHPS